LHLFYTQVYSKVLSCYPKDILYFKIFTSMKITSIKNLRRASAIIGCLLVITASSCASYKTCPTYAKKTTKTAQSSVNS